MNSGTSLSLSLSLSRLDFAEGAHDDFAKNSSAHYTDPDAWPMTASSPSLESLYTTNTPLNSTALPVKDPRFLGLLFVSWFGLVGTDALHPAGGSLGSL
jgi:hypothetical protein